ncbi:hypothetical protein ES703_104742 [subsurface metagenome]
MNNNPHRGIYNQTYGIGYAVGNGEELNSKFTQGKCFTGRYHLQVNSRTCAALLQLDRDNALGELGGIDRHIKLGEDVGQGTDMVFVPVGDDNAPYPVLSLQ